MNSGESRVFQNWLKNLPQPKSRTNQRENTEQSNKPKQQSNKQRQQQPPKENKTNDSKKHDKPDGVLPKRATIIQPSRDDKENSEPRMVQLVEPIVAEPEPPKVEEVAPLIINLKEEQPKKVNIGTTEQPIGMDPDVLQALQALKDNGIELPLSVSQVIQNLKEPEVSVAVPVGVVVEKEEEPIIVSAKPVLDEPIKVPIVEDVVKEVPAPSLTLEPPVQSTEALLLKMEETFTLQPRYATNVRSCGFFEPIQTGEKYLFVLEEKTQVDMLVMNLARLGIEGVEIIAPFAEDGRGLDLSEMNVEMMVESLVKLLADSSTRSRTALTNHLYLLKLLNRYDFESIVEVFNQPNDFYYHALQPFKNEYERTKEEWEIPKNVQSVLNGIVVWLEQQYQPVQLGRKHVEEPKAYTFNTKHLDTLMDGLNMLQTNVTLQHLFNNEVNVPILKTFEHTDVVIVLLDRVYTEKSNYVSKCIEELVKDYVTYIQVNYQGKKPLNIVTLLEQFTKVKNPYRHI